MPLTLEKIEKREITVAVVGLGYVGYPLSLVFAEAGVSVLGFDVDQEKIESIEKGNSYIRHIEESRLKKNLSSGKYRATMNFSEIEQCNAIIICVPTPLNHYLEPDLQYIRATCEAIAPHLQRDTLVILESTTWPGTTQEIVRPILEKNSSFQLGNGLYLAYSPEREDPGNKEYSTKEIPKLVGGANEKSLELAVALYSLALDQVVPLSNTRVAEAAKLFENIYRSVNIALVNEMKLILDKMSIDVWEVIEAAGTKPFGFMSFWPGPGLGGHCIPIDPFYLSWKAKEYGINTRFIELAGEINRQMPTYVVGKVQDCLNHQAKALKNAKILILGIAYKADIDDMRESPSLELIRIMEEKGAVVDYNDPYIPEIGPTREYNFLQGRKSQEITKGYDCFVLATKHTQYCPEKILSYGVPIVDTRNCLPKHERVFNA